MKTLDDIIPADVKLEDCEGLPEIGAQIECNGVKHTVKRRVIATAKQMHEWVNDNEEVDPNLVFAMSYEFKNARGLQGVVAVLECTTSTSK